MVLVKKPNVFYHEYKFHTFCVRHCWNKTYINWQCKDWLEMNVTKVFSIFFLYEIVKQAMTEAAIFTIGRSRIIGYGKIRPLADYRSRSRLLNLKSTWLNCILFVVYVLYVTHNLTKGWGLGLNHFKFLHDLVKNWLPFLMPSFF